jgi:tryptophan synthase alpha chain
MNAMPDRVEQLFRRCREEKRAAFIPYICAGDPTLEKTVELALALECAGADLIELGVPFSDPLADGIVNQLAAQRALQNGATTAGVLECVRKIRRQSEVPIVLYTYLNPILQFGFERFHEVANEAGVDGLLLLDLPPDEQMENAPAKPLHVCLVAPTTPDDRLKIICGRAAGFIYYVSREGVTGARSEVAASLRERLADIRHYTDLPIAVGFGISTPEQASEVARLADGVVVGSAIVDGIAKGLDVNRFAQELARAVHEARR